MKKIDHIVELQFKKKRLLQQRKDLEKNIRLGWQDLKESLTPSNIANDTINEIIRNETKNNLDKKSILSSTMTYGFTLLARKIAEKTGDKLEHIFKRKSP